MGKSLIIAEKPSVASDIAKALGGFKKNKDVTNLNDKCWERLKSMAFETYVPESETSKSGAGY